MSAEVSKMDRLTSILESLGHVAVSYSGGVDSTFLLLVAQKVLGTDRVKAVTIASHITPPWDIGFAESFCRKTGVDHTIVEAPEKLEDPDFSENTPRRCYYCKVINHSLIRDAVPDGYTIVSGTNLSDLGDDRPGLEAEEKYGIGQPLKEAGFSKDDIRLFSRELGISGWDRPASACLASRIPHGTPLNRRDIERVKDAELYLRSLGLAFVRVRAYPESTAKIETEAGEMVRILDEGGNIVRKLKGLGFHYVTLDLEGYIPAGMKYRQIHDNGSH